MVRPLVLKYSAAWCETAGTSLIQPSGLLAAKAATPSTAHTSTAVPVRCTGLWTASCLSGSALLVEHDQDRRSQHARRHENEDLRAQQGGSGRPARCGATIGLRRVKCAFPGSRDASNMFHARRDR